MMRRVFVLAFALSLVVISSAVAERISLPIESTCVIDDGEGTYRCLLRVGNLDALDGVIISEALLKLDTGGTLTAPIVLQAHPILEPWSAGSTWESFRTPGGTLDEGVYWRREIEPREMGNTVAISIRPILAEMQAGLTAYGIALTAAPYRGDGLNANEIARLTNLASATVEVSYVREVPHRGTR
jgi:hypothetical protein